MKAILPFLAGLVMLAAFLVSVADIACMLCKRWFAESPWHIRGCAMGIVFFWFLSVFFAALMSACMFAPLPAAITAVIVAVAANRLRMQPPTSTASVADDLLRFRSLIARKKSVVWWIGLTCFLVLFALLSVRALALPLLGWDYLTYHGVKAGLWVQAGKWTSLDAPGGWEYYQSYFGGGEIFTAWAMLFFHSDLLAGIPDVFFWLLVGLMATSLAIEFGMRPRTAVLVGMAFLCALDLSRMVGSGYVDTCANAFVLGGILFLVRCARSKKPADLCMAAAAFGLASSVKVNMLAVSFLMALPVIILLLRRRWWSIKAYSFCLLGFAAPVAPWLFFNYLSTGDPLGALGCSSLNIGLIRLGTTPPNLRWFLERPDLSPYNFYAEAAALFSALHNYGFALLLAGLGVPGLLLNVGRRRSGYILIFLLAASIAALYFSPSFSVIRLGWAGQNGRFLLPIIIMIAAAGLPALQGFRYGVLLIENVSAVAVIMGVCMSIRSIALGQGRVEILFLALAVLLTVLVYCVPYRKVLASSAMLTIVTALCAVTFAVTMCALARFKNSFRVQALCACTTMHDFPRYWVPGLRALAAESQPLRIAFTYGPQQISHGAFLAPFLGEHLNNQLLYVSPDTSSLVVPHHPDYLAGACPSFPAWIDSLQHAGATHVLCLQPPCIELFWMQDQPHKFECLAGQVDNWGLFRFKRSSQ